MQTKRAYPVADDGIQPIRYDLTKWLAVMRDLNIKTAMGQPRETTLEQLTASFPATERFDFLNWLRYYESGDQRKYKTAQAHPNYYMSDAIPNYFLPNPAHRIPSPIRSLNDEINSVMDGPTPNASTKTSPNPNHPIEPESPGNVEWTEPVVPDTSKEDAATARKALVEGQRAKILGRLHSAEKLLSSQDGQMFAGEDFERLLSSIYDLKRQIQLANKVSMSAQTCTDLIVRQARILHREGHEMASQFMVKLAQQTPSNGQANLGEIPLGGSQPQGQGSLGNNLPAQVLANPDPKDLGLEDETPKTGIPGFLDNLSGAGITLFDKNDSEDNVEADDVSLDDDVSVDDNQWVDDGEELQVTAQEAPPEPTEVESAAPPARPAKPQAENPTGKRPAGVDSAEPRRDDIDDIIDSALGGITIENVLTKLEDISKIFRNREIARNLTVVDLMLNKLGLAEMFPSLGEIASKTFDSGQYCLTRLEDIISRLHAAHHVSDIDLERTTEPTTPAAANIKQNLQQTDQKEKDRKRLREEMSDKQLAEKVKPEVQNPEAEVGAEPAALEAESPAPEEPAAPPARPAKPSAAAPVV